MKISKKLNPILLVFIVYIVCYAFRMIELLVLKTDTTPIGEAFIHKLLGIVILIFAVKYANLNMREIGFSRNNSVKGTLIGLGIGGICFFIAYLSEYIMLNNAVENPQLNFFASAFSLEGNIGANTSFIAIFMCILFNIVNVVMEEGIFRGLFIKQFEKRFSFIIANLISALLFGLWHIALPIREYSEGTMSALGAVSSGLMYILTSGLMGFQLGLLSKMTKGLWAPMAVHFVNNAIVNLLHFTSGSGTDTLVFVRITIAQTLSFIAVLVAYIVWRKKQINTDIR